MRIVSLLPSATEIICALGLGEQLVGVTHECDYPEGVVRSLPKVTGARIPEGATSREIDRLVSQRLASEPSLYSLHVGRLSELAPDLVVTQKLCNVCAVSHSDVEVAFERMPHRPQLVNLAPESLQGVFDTILEVGRAAAVESAASRVVDRLCARVAAVEASVAAAPSPRVALLEWLDPPFSAGHWNPELIRIAGGRDRLSAEGARSRRLEWSQLAAWAPEVIVIACCGYTAERARADLAFAEAAPGWCDLPAVRAGRVYVFDGSQYFNRPGPRLVDSLEMLASVLHPGLMSSRSQGTAGRKRWATPM